MMKAALYRNVLGRFFYFGVQYINNGERAGFSIYVDRYLIKLLWEHLILEM